MRLEEWRNVSIISILKLHTQARWRGSKRIKGDKRVKWIDWGNKSSPFISVALHQQGGGLGGCQGNAEFGDRISTGNTWKTILQLVLKWNITGDSSLFHFIPSQCNIKLSISSRQSIHRIFNIPSPKWVDAFWHEYATWTKLHYSRWYHKRMHNSAKTRLALQISPNPILSFFGSRSGPSVPTNNWLG